jgi:hypothetical protein
MARVNRRSQVGDENGGRPSGEPQMKSASTGRINLAIQGVGEFDRNG